MMEFKDLLELPKSFRKHPVWTTICVLIVVVIGIFFGTNIIGKKTKDIQHTEGSQSPAVMSGGGDVTITYGMADETIKALLDYKNARDMDIEKLKKRLEEIHKAEFDSLPGEAEKWASHFIESMPIRDDMLKSQEETIEKERIGQSELSLRLKSKIGLLFDYIFKSLDSKISALQDLDKDIQYSQNDNFALFDAPSSKVREILFNNGSSITLTLIPGAFQNGLLEKCPKLTFSENIRNTSRHLFTVQEPQRGINIVSVGPLVKDVEEPKISNVIYSVEGESLISEGFKSSFLKSFDEALGRVRYKDRQISN